MAAKNNSIKTTVELDQAKLARVMKLTGIKTLKKALDFALDQAERAAQICSVFEQADFYLSADKPVIDPDYSVEQVRSLEIPGKTRGRIR